MNFLVLACGGPSSGGFGLAILAFLLVVGLVLATMGGSVVLGVLAYSRRSLRFAIIAAVLAALNLVVAVHVPLYLMAVFACFALAAAAAARSQVHTA